jgi:hypothetical protein
VLAWPIKFASVLFKIDRARQRGQGITLTAEQVNTLAVGLELLALGINREES